MLRGHDTIMQACNYLLTLSQQILFVLFYLFACASICVCFIVTTRATVDFASTMQTSATSATVKETTSDGANWIGDDKSFENWHNV